MPNLLSISKKAHYKHKQQHTVTDRRYQNKTTRDLQNNCKSSASDLTFEIVNDDFFRFGLTAERVVFLMVYCELTQFIGDLIWFANALSKI